MTATDAPARIQVRRTIDAPPEAVFDAWLDPSSAGKWLFATRDGEMVRVDIDPQVGGAFAFVDRRDGEDVLHAGTWLELDRPRLLAFTFQVPLYSPEVDRVTVEIAPVGGGSEVVLTHDTRPAPVEDLAKYEHGWGMILGGLAAQLGDRG